MPGLSAHTVTRLPPRDTGDEVGDRNSGRLCAARPWSRPCTATRIMGKPEDTVLVSILLKFGIVALPVAMLTAALLAL